MIDWHVGQKVVCVDASGRFWAVLSGELIQDSIYTIRSVCLYEGRCGLRLQEILCRDWWDGEECVFAESRFRPVVSPEADISVFERILRDVNKREVVDA